MSKIALIRIQYLNSLIKSKSTGPPKKLATKLNISPRAVHNYVKFMRLKGAPIKYDKLRETYFYSYEFNFIIGFIPE